MKKPLLILLAAVAVIYANCSAFAEDEESAGKVIAYYFYGNIRCQTCHMIEQYSRETIEENFQEALFSGKLEFQAVNVEESGNEHWTQDYQLYTKSLILSLVKDGQEVKSKNLTKIWEYVCNKQRFFDYIIAEVNSFLKEAQ